MYINVIYTHIYIVFGLTTGKSTKLSEFPLPFGRSNKSCPTLKISMISEFNAIQPAFFPYYQIDGIFMNIPRILDEEQHWLNHWRTLYLLVASQLPFRVTNMAQKYPSYPGEYHEICFWGIPCLNMNCQAFWNVSEYVAKISHLLMHFRWHTEWSCHSS